MEFVPINGLSACAYGSLRLGWCRLKTNGCAVAAIYNALGFLGHRISLGEILRSFHAWYRPRFFGIWPWRIRSFLRQRGVSFCRSTADWRHGDVAIVTYWNRCFCNRFINPFGGAHTVCVRYDGQFWIYNRFSNRQKVYCCNTFEELLSGRRLIQCLRMIN